MNISVTIYDNAPVGGGVRYPPALGVGRRGALGRLGMLNPGMAQMGAMGGMHWGGLSPRERAMIFRSGMGRRGMGMDPRLAMRLGRGWPRS